MLTKNCVLQSIHLSPHCALRKVTPPDLCLMVGAWGVVLLGCMRGRLGVMYVWVICSPTAKGKSLPASGLDNQWTHQLHNQMEKMIMMMIIINYIFLSVPVKLCLEAEFLWAWHPGQMQEHFSWWVCGWGWACVSYLGLWDGQVCTGRRLQKHGLAKHCFHKILISLWLRPEFDP